MAKTIELLLLETVENLGIVGDIVRVKPGYARNYLVPLQLAEKPTPIKIDALKERRAEAQRELSLLRSAREELLARMEEVEITLIRSCNDQGGLYGSVTQRDIADALQEAGYDVGVRSIRLSQSIRRIGPYAVPIQFETDLRTEVTISVEPDHPLEEREEMEFDDEGNLIEPKPRKRPRDDEPKAETQPAEAAEGAAEGAAEAAAEEKATT